MEPSNISGNTIAVAGASSGLGESIARRLAARGAAVVLDARRKESQEL